MSRYIYDFSEGRSEDRALLGGKGADLAEMVHLGLPVPPGFTIITEACRHYLRHGSVPDELPADLSWHLSRLEQTTGRRLGDAEDPLLVSVRSGAETSMPGMMDTVLDIGLNDRSVEGLARCTGDARFAYDCYRRLVEMFGETVLGVPRDRYAEALDRVKSDRGLTLDVELTETDLRALVDRYLDITETLAGRSFPQDPRDQLDLAVRRRLRVLAGRARRPLPPPARDRPRPRRGGERAGDGVREQRVRLRIGRRVHPRSRQR